jgi:hypothetical protein
MVKPTVCQPDQLATGARFVDCVYGCLVNILFFPVKLVLGKLMLILPFRRFGRWQGGTTTRSA